MTIMYYTTLSLYRIDNKISLLALFITFASINALYTCKLFTSYMKFLLTALAIWDLAMDWSLCQPGAEKRFLRNVRGYKSTWPYYLAMIIDPILRFNWIFYIVYTHDLQHSSIASFLIAFSEVSRRGMWTLFRVENEHCANVAHFKASRDIPLPYPLSPTLESDTFAGQQPVSEPPEAEATTTQSSPAISRHRSRTTAAEEGESAAAPSNGLRHRAPTRTLTSIFAEAHTQDFEKKRRPGAGDSGRMGDLRRERIGSDDDGRAASSDDEDDEEDAMRLIHVEGLERREEREDD
jgi:xenotropic and polytropic retrovirus receptor 1